eukprot:CAMPEP_0119323720 /NCGR_PEP_ID=MMETSP1333-20130426/61404_1 /TAXON_ID=418940 /ORGANISM="Scyphosphaera apsteinii, Strain RCC1455" /LENGTH=178 /DNA_ID=CAMNT_0007331237 /DNA_START=83 /DNA_END=622 /DNA_ORIENTATION=+
MHPLLKLRKRLNTLGTTVSLGCDYDVFSRVVTFDTTWCDSIVGGELSLSNFAQLEWRKVWLFPGLSDAATRIELSSSFDLTSRCADAKLRVGLRRKFSKRGLSFVHTMPLDGKTGHCKLDLGASLTVPNELQLTDADVRDAARRLTRRGFGTGSTPPFAGPEMNFALDLDRLDIRLDL